MLVRPIKLKGRQNSFELSSPRLLDVPPNKSGINKPRFELAAELITKSQQMRKVHMLKLQELTPKYIPRSYKHFSQIDSHSSPPLTDIEWEGPNLPGSSNPMLISVTRSKARPVIETKTPIKRSPPSSASRKSTVERQSAPKLNVLSAKIEISNEDSPKKPVTPTLKRLKVAPQTKSENYFLQKPKRRSSLKPSDASTYWLTRRLTIESTDLMTPMSRIFDIGQVIRATSGIIS